MTNPEGDYFDLTPDEVRQRLVKAPQPTDANPAGITVRQAARMSVLLRAGLLGHDVSEPLRDIEQFLFLSAVVNSLPGTVSLDQADVDRAWQQVETWPIPPPGPPVPQLE